MNWRIELSKLADDGEDFVKFSKPIMNTSKKLLGVRTPKLRQFAKKMANEISSHAEMDEFLDEVDDKVYEEVVLAGLMINSVKLTPEEKIELTRKYLDKVDSWAEVDIFVEKKPKYQTELYWNFAVENMESNREFLVRYGVIVLMSNFLTDEKLDQVFGELRKIKSDKYYVKMGMAWLYSAAAIKFYDKTIAELQRGEIGEWTRNKAFQKMLESYRITDEQKKEVRSIK